MSMVVRRGWFAKAALAWLLVVCWAPGLAAQHDRAQAPGWSVGTSVTGESLPLAIDPRCGSVQGHRGAKSLGAHLLVPFGPVTLEGRATRHLSSANFCARPLIDSGVVTTYDTGVSAGGFTTTDLRARIGIGAQGVFVAVGSGWAWRKNVPYASLAFGIRGGSTIRGGFDIGIDSYRIKWRSTTTEYRYAAAPRILEERTYSRWDTAIGMRMVLEVPVG